MNQNFYNPSKTFPHFQQSELIILLYRIPISLKSNHPNRPDKLI